MNRLQHETSPYLLQHADNPVDWFPWGDEAFAKASREDKPVLISIGYATCHWCHVMERESFRDPDIAAFMNKYFVNVKIDREERPDLDHIYMEAGYLLNRSSGWPLHCFLTPEGKPFFAGTYFPPEEGAKQMSWSQALQYALFNFRENRRAVEYQAERITLALRKQSKESAVPGLPPSLPENPFSHALPDLAFEKLRSRFDPDSGGFGEAPRFPDLPGLRFLLHYHYYTGNQQAVGHLLLTLGRMLRGGIWDLLGGGLARYAVDRHWRIPHFEKMLYDNAQLAALLADMYALTREKRWKNFLEKTLDFMRAELLTAEGGYGSGLDAESEGKEGKFYTWTPEELQNALSPELFPVAVRIFGLSPKEGAHTLQHGDFPAEQEPAFAAICAQLEKARSLRPRPRRDDKVILGWNALVVSAFTRGYEVSGNESLQAEASRLAEYLLNTFQREDLKTFHRVAANGKTHQDALLQDYAYLAQALLDLHRITMEKRWLEKSLEIAETALALFDDPEGALLFTGGPGLIVRSKETQDLELPSGNAVMAQVLSRLGLLFARADLREKAARMLLSVKENLTENPAAHGVWLCQWMAESQGINEITLSGKGAADTARHIEARFIPNAVLLMDEKESENAYIYVCRDQTCFRPVSTLEDFFSLIQPQPDGLLLLPLAPDPAEHGRPDPRPFD